MSEFEELMSPRGEYRLDDVSLSVTAEEASFRACLSGPRGAAVWARAWISDDNGTLAETVAPKSIAGDTVTIDVPMPPSLDRCIAVIRIESKPLETEHILMRRLS